VDKQVPIMNELTV